MKSSEASGIYALPAVGVCLFGRTAKHMKSRSRNTTAKKTAMTKKLAPVHPGEILLEDYMKPLGLSAHRLALDLHVPPNRIAAIVRGQRAITADTAMRLARYFTNTSPQFWLSGQVHFDLEVAKDELTADIEREVNPCTLAS